MTTSQTSWSHSYPTSYRKEGKTSELKITSIHIVYSCEETIYWSESVCSVILHKMIDKRSTSFGEMTLVRGVVQSGETEHAALYCSVRMVMLMQAGKHD